MMDWLMSKDATMAEMRIFTILNMLHKKKKAPVALGDIMKEDSTGRQNITTHLRGMIKKNIVKRYSFGYFLPVKKF